MLCPEGKRNLEGQALLDFFPLSGGISLYPVSFLYGWPFLAPQHKNGQLSSFLRFYILKALEYNEIFYLLNRYISLATSSVVIGLVVGL